MTMKTIIRQKTILLLVLLVVPSLILHAEETDQIVLHRHNPKVINLSVRNMKMRELAELLTRSCGIPVVVSRGAAETPVDTYLENLDAIDVLRTVCRACNLWYREQEKGVYEVLTLDEFRNSARIYQEDYVEVVTLLYPAAEDVGKTLRNMYPDRIVWTDPDDDLGDRSDDISKALDRMDQLVSRAQFATQVSSSSGSNSNNDNDDDDDDNDSDSSSRSERPDDAWQAERLTRLISKMNAEEFSGTTNLTSVWHNSGEFGFVYVASFPGPNQLLLRSSDLRAIKQIREVIKKMDTVTAQVLLEVKVLEISLDDEHDVGIDWLFSKDYDDPRFQASGGFANGFPGGSGGNQLLGPNLLLQPQGSGLDPRAFVFNLISDDIRVRLNLLEKEGRVTQLATPSLTVADSEASVVFIGKEVTIPLSISSQDHYYGADNNLTTSYDLKTERRNVGDTLLLTPKLHADRTVTLRVLQENSQLGDIREISYGKKSEYTMNTQDIDKRTVASTVVAGDGTMVALGGLIREKVYKNVEGIPGLMNLPLLGALFRRTVEQRSRSELMVIIIPYILVAPGETDQVSHDFLERISQHPSAHGDIPPLEVSVPQDIAKPDVIAPKGSFFERLKRTVRIWRVEP